MQKLTLLQTDFADRMFNHGGGYAASQGMCWAFMSEALFSGALKVHALRSERGGTATLIQKRAADF